MLLPLQAAKQAVPGSALPGMVGLRAWATPWPGQVAPNLGMGWLANALICGWVGWPAGWLAYWWLIGSLGDTRDAALD